MRSHRQRTAIPGEAIAFSIPAAHRNGFVWRWRCLDGEDASEKAFEMYYDCLEDARRRGYHIEPARATGLTAPGGERHGLA